MNYLFLFAGLALLLLGAEFLVDSSVAIAKRARISNFIIGLTVVGMGTSAPELFVSISSSLEGPGDVSMGNIIGSNICNIFLILDVSAAIRPFPIQKSIIRRDIPFGIFAALLVTVLANKSLLSENFPNALSRQSSILFLVLFFAYIGYTVHKSRKETADTEGEAVSRLTGKPMPLLIPIAIASLAGLIFGASSSSALRKTWRGRGE